MKHLIIGGVAGGATAAARIRRVDESAEILLIEKGQYISYANCGLPYYIGGTIKERDKLFVQTPASFGKRFNVDVRVENEVIQINPAGKSVSIRRKDGSVYTETYDKLLLSPGSVPVRPPLPGIDLEGIFTLRNVDDTDQIKDYLLRHQVKDAVVVGGGFIGLEMAENLSEAGVHVSIVEKMDQVMAPVDFSTAAVVHGHLIDKGVSLFLKTGVERFEKTDDGKIRVFFDTGVSVDTNMVLLSIGVRPSVELAREAGIKLGMRGIQVNDYLETSVQDIYAVGDAIEFTHPLTGKPWLNYLAGPANRQARIVADNMVKGNHVTYEGAIGTSIAKVFDLTVGATGLPAKMLKANGMAYQSSTTHSASHAGYYPGSFTMTLKITFDPSDGRLFGAQAVGHDGVDKRIDEIAQIIKHKGTVYDLMQTEQCYAPPYSSAKDPVAIAGYVAGNILSKAMHPIYWREIEGLDLSKTRLVDVRTVSEFELGHIKGAINIPVDELRQRLSELSKDDDIVVYCQVGLRGYLAERILTGNGFTQVRNLSGGYRTYSCSTAEIDPFSISGCGCNREENKESAPIASCGCSSTVVKLDACGLQCPGPILKLKEAVDQAKAGDRIEVVATDAGFARDVQSWCKSTGNKLLSQTESKGYYTVQVQKAETPSCQIASAGGSKNKTLIMFSDDLDRAIATFVLANGAAATGHKVSIFFTFWGLNVIKKESKPRVNKDFFGKMFGWMMPSHSKKLKLSQMSMLGIGDRLIRHIMKKKNISSLEELRDQALKNGVEFIACQMTMDMMSIQKEELLDGVTIGGVATYMERAENAGVNLFI